MKYQSDQYSKSLSDSASSSSRIKKTDPSIITDLLGLQNCCGKNSCDGGCILKLFQDKGSYRFDDAVKYIRLVQVIIHNI